MSLFHPMSPMRIVWLVLTVLGTVVPMYYFLGWLSRNNWDLGAMIEAWNVTDATTGLVYDLTIAAVALTIWVIADCIQRRDWGGLLAVPTIYCIGVSCGLPLHLFLRSRSRS